MKYLGYKIYKEKDAEGRKAYFIGIEGIEPSKMCPLYSLAVAKANIKERKNQEEQGGRE